MAVWDGKKKKKRIQLFMGALEQIQGVFRNFTLLFHYISIRACRGLTVHFPCKNKIKMLGL